MKSEWIAKAIGGAIGLLFFLAIYVGVAETAFGGVSSGINKGSIQDLKTNINSVCSGETESAGANLNLNSGVEITLKGNNINVEGGSSDEELEDNTVNCKIKSETTIEQSQQYEIIDVENGGYRFE